MTIEVTQMLFKDYVNEGKVPASNFVVDKSSKQLNPDELKDGEILVETLYLSVDPYMRTRMIKMEQTAALIDQKYYIGSGFQPGQPLLSGGIGQVKSSKSAGFSEGDVVSGMLPWATHNVIDKQAQEGLMKIDPSLLGKVPLSYFLGVLGMPGMTAYAGLKKIGEPKQGEVAVVSAASGAVGQVVGQLLKNVYGCYVIGSAGSDDKVALLKDLGYDYAFNYKTHSKGNALKEAAPDGIDIYFENVGGPVLEQVIDLCREHARIIACGMISQYDLPNDQKYGVKNLFQLVTKRIKMQGFIVSDYAAELGAEFAKSMGQYVQQGKIKAVEHVTEGIENAGQAFIDMMSGKNVGKAVVKVCKQDPFPVRK